MSQTTTEGTERSGQRLVSFFEKEPKKRENDVGVDLVPLSVAGSFELAAPAAVGTVYVTHPRNVSQLIPFADYDELVAQDKLNEALRVFTSLGAARIVARAVRKDAADGHFRFGPLTIGGSRRSSWSIAYEHNGTGGPPVDPRPLRYPDEPTMDATCEAVLRLGTERGRIEIRSTPQFDVDGELARRLKKAGFSLGLGGSKSTINEFIIEAAFTPDAAAELDPIVEAASEEAKTRPRLLARIVPAKGASR